MKNEQIDQSNYWLICKQEDMKGAGRKVGKESELFGLLLLKTQKKIKKKRKIKLHELCWIIDMSGLGKYKFRRKTDWSLRDFTVHYNTPHGGLLIVTDVNGKPTGTRYTSKRRHLSQEQVKSLIMVHSN
ncbi:uncharacterized protein LOC113278316 [Papaver somniferum]|uniref:uncharacterized protein LOC113278316 n=1 Tax=Papaver somniferum TaxID=3469 RepID=UPI000E6FC96E|nr:uncharacterized protein LOC113278316 [Papaver somniferum]